MPGEASFHLGWTYKGGDKSASGGNGGGNGGESGAEILRAPAPPPGAIKGGSGSHASHASDGNGGSGGGGGGGGGGGRGGSDDRTRYTTGAATATRSPPPPTSSSPAQAHAAPIYSLSVVERADPQPPQSSPANFFSHAERRRHSTRSYFKALPEMVICCCCCPIYKCVLWACALELVVSLYCWYRMLTVVLATINHFETKDGVIFFILTFWIVTLITATALIVASQRRKNASYVLPRLIQQAGLLIVGILTAFAITFYFFGSSSTINSYIMTLYKMFTGLRIGAEDERELSRDIRTAALICIPIIMVFVPYVAINLWTTRRYYNKLKNKYGDGFQPVGQSEMTAAAASAPPPPINPHFKA